MSQVGEFPGLNAGSKYRKTIRTYDNPMDRCTIVSIFPKDIVEVKPTIQPGVFRLPAGSYENPSLLVVGPSSWWRDLGEHEPFLEIPNGSIQIANSIVKDFANGLIGCNMNDSMPGLFWIHGEIGIIELKSKYKKQLDAAKVKQDNYFKALVQIADIGWARSNGNPLTINEDMRTAARILKLETKDWMRDFTMLEKTSCPACGAPYNPAFPICSSCKTVVNPAKFKELGLELAK